MANEHFWSRGLSEEAAQAEVLLARYPHISELEVADLIRAFSRLPLLDFGLVAADDRLGPQLDAFYADHGEKLRTPLRRIALVLAWLAFITLAAIMYFAMT